MAEKRARAEMSILQIVMWQEVLEERRYSRQMGLTTNEQVRAVLEILRKTEKRHKKETLASLKLGERIELMHASLLAGATGVQ